MRTKHPIPNGFRNMNSKDEGCISFVKACALGNDFVIVSENVSDDQKELSALSKKLADRRWGIGCDQAIYVRPTDDVHVYQIRFFNADGSEAEACGNGSRCVAKLLIQQHNLKGAVLQTAGGTLDCNLLDDGTVSVILPKPVCVKTVDLKHGEGYAVFVDVGNPHLVCFVDDITVSEKLEAILETYLHEIDPSMPPRVNVGFAKVVDRHTLLLNVWERGAGFTQACGTGACAALAAGQAHGLVEQTVHVHQKGGPLIIQLNEQHLILQGEAHLIYNGAISILD